MRRLLAICATIAPVAATAVAGVVLQDTIASGAGEAEAVAVSRGLVRRDGSELMLRMAGGADLILTDRTRCGDLRCPAAVMSRYRYKGWDPVAGGYRIAIGVDKPVETVLAWDTPLDNPVLLEAKHVAARMGGPLSLPDGPPNIQAAGASLADWQAQTSGARDQVEAPRLAQHPDNALRRGSELVIKLGDGRSLVLTDDLVCGQVICPSQIVTAFEFAGTSADGRYDAVIQRWSEGESGLLIEASSGEVTALAGPPSFAPDGKRAAATGSDPESQAPNALEVWSIAGDRPSLAFAVKNDIGADAYQIVGWEDADHLRVMRGPRNSGQRAPAMLANEAGTWHLEEAQ